MTLTHTHARWRWGNCHWFQLTEPISISNWWRCAHALEWIHFVNPKWWGMRLPYTSWVESLECLKMSISLAIFTYNGERNDIPSYLHMVCALVGVADQETKNEAGGRERETGIRNCSKKLHVCYLSVQVLEYDFVANNIRASVRRPQRFRMFFWSIFKWQIGRRKSSIWRRILSGSNTYYFMLRLRVVQLKWTQMFELNSFERMVFKCVLWIRWRNLTWLKIQGHLEMRRNCLNFTSIWSHLFHPPCSPPSPPCQPILCRILTIWHQLNDIHELNPFVLSKTSLPSTSIKILSPPKTTQKPIIIIPLWFVSAPLLSKPQHTSHSGIYL